MLVFIDESGDPGFKLNRGSSPVFVASMVVFRDGDEARRAQGLIADLRQELRIEPEFKFNKSSYDTRDAFFEAVRHCSFRVRCVVVRKAVIHSDNLRTKKESFYKFFMRMMMQHDGGVLRDAKIVIDGSGDREFKRQFRTFLRNHLPRECMRKLDLKDSVRDPLIQLADMTAGAVARSYRSDRPNPGRWMAMLRSSGKIHNVWEFK
jgi:hypothetical protein